MKHRAFTLVELLVVIAIILVLVGILVPTLTGVMESGRRGKCTSNVKSIGKALHEYASDRSAALPSFESTNGAWQYVGYYNNMPGDPYIADGTRPLFMLMYTFEGGAVKAVNYISPAAFICPSVSSAAKDPIAYATQVGFTSYQNISYSYQHQTRIATTSWPLSLINDPARVILADKNPLTAYSGTSLSRGGTTCYRLDPTGRAHSSNSANHNYAGQQVLRLDASVSWQTLPTLGIAGDNIWDPSNLLTGNLTGYEVPKSADDIFLVP